MQRRDHIHRIGNEIRRQPAVHTVLPLHHFAGFGVHNEEFIFHLCFVSRNLERDFPSVTLGVREHACISGIPHAHRWRGSHHGQRMIVREHVECREH